MADYAEQKAKVVGAGPMVGAQEAPPGKQTLVERAYPAVQPQSGVGGGATAGAAATPTAALAPASHSDWMHRIFGRPDEARQSAAVVQRRGGGPANAQVHAAAARGIEGPATSLPFADQIQASFGPRHDVTAIRAHIGGPADEAASAMGASAYATGHHVVFARAPDLHMAAHEAAHVVQQAYGVSLYGGVGQVGDRYEQHADVVADRVVAGRSAADLFGQPPGVAPDRAREARPEHACSECGGATKSTGECTTCKAGSAVSSQHAAVPAVQRKPEPTDPPSGNSAAAPSADQAKAPISTWGWGGDAARNVYALCNSVEMGRAEFLAFEATALSKGAKRASLAQAKGGFGITTSTVTDAKPPPIATEEVQEGGKTKFRLKPTHAEMAPIQSATTVASEFVEGIFHWGNQGGALCPSGNYPIRWVLTADGAAKVKQGEQEHCNDFRAAFDNTLVLYASSINNVAAANRVYSTEKQAIDDALSYLGMTQPDEMMTNYIAAAGRTVARDRSAHVAKPRMPQEPDPGCREMRIVLGAAAWPGVPGTASQDVVNPPRKP